jgi:serine/threonine protein kinase
VATKYRKGDVVDGWTLGRSLGRGGNGEVWEAERGDLRLALKILKPAGAGSEPYRRFRDEIAVHTLLGECAGVLPMRDHRLPANPHKNTPAWLAMPIARRIEMALGVAPSLERVLKAVAEIAETLASLAERQIAHRDLKPQNLFERNGAWLVGDLGVAVFVGKETATRTGRQVGARHFIAPEVVRDPQNASPYPADVYSLAQTLFVLASGQRYPPAGGVRAFEQSAQLRSYVDHPRVPTIDWILEQATATTPSERPTMKELASTLRIWLRGPPPAVSPLDLSDLAVAAEQRVRDATNAAARRAALNGHADRLRKQAKTGVDEIARSVAEVLSGFKHEQGIGFDRSFITFISGNLEAETFSGQAAYGILEVHRFTLDWPSHLSLWTGIGLLMNSSGKMLLAAGHIIGHGQGSYVGHAPDAVVVMRDPRVVSVGTPEAEEAVGQQVRALAETSRAAVEQFLRLPAE